MTIQNNDSSSRAVGLFSNRAEAEQAMYRLRDMNFNMDKVSVINRSTEDADESIPGAGDKSKTQQAKGGAGAGAIMGAATGGAIGLLGGLGVLLIPGVGPIAEAGVLLANMLLGGGLGAVGGSLVGALMGWGLPENQAMYYNTRVYDHNEYLVLVEGSEIDIQAAQAILDSHGIRDWHVFSMPGAVINPQVDTIP
ncbi:MAG: hypothetical protein WBA13_16230 [Microcoleaceae cyanobacterium]